jgi:outer membrane protein OmpA-like peptidoglycan-associated protein
MKLVTCILTPLTALCLFGRGSDASSQETRFREHVVDDCTEERRVAADLAFVETRAKEQAGDRKTDRVGVPVKAAHSGPETSRVAAIPKGRLLFAANSVVLTARNRKALECAAAWLREHPEVRVLIVGYCDDSGSEECTAALAEHRADVVRQLLLKLGTGPNQVAGVKGWENLNGACRASVAECQRQNRSARLFVSKPVGSLK